MAKHIIYLNEGSETAALTVSHLLESRQQLRKQPLQDDDAIPIMRLTSQMLKQKAVQFEVCKLRMTSLEKRIQNIIGLVRKKLRLLISDLNAGFFSSLSKS